MKKVFLPLLALATMASCTQSEMDQRASDEQVPIMLGANALSVEASTRAPFEGTIGATNKLTAYVLASTTQDDYTTKYATGTMVFGDESTAVGYLTDNTASPAPVVPFNGKSYYPTNGDKLYFAALYPATGWGGITTTSTFVFSGKEDVMVAAQVSGDKTAHPATVAPDPVTTSTIPAFAFKHLLTKLDFILQAEDATAQSAWGEITKIELVKAAGVGPNTKVEVTLATGKADLSPTNAFSSSVAAFKCYKLTATGAGTSGDPYVKTYAEDEYTFVAASGYALTATPTFQAYSIVAPIIATGTADFTVKVYASGAKNGAVEVPVDLKKAGAAFAQSTQGKAFNVTLKFKAKAITATAAVTGWDEGNVANDPTEIE